MQPVNQMTREEVKQEYDLYIQCNLGDIVKLYPRVKPDNVKKNDIILHRGSLNRVIRVNKITLTLKPLLKYYKDCRRNGDLSYAHDPDRKILYDDLEYAYIIPYEVATRMVWIHKRINHLDKATRA